MSDQFAPTTNKKEATMIVEPSVKLLAHTTIDTDAISELMEIQPESTDAETLVTFAGRSCYESWDRPREATRQDCDYIQRTIFEQQHGSILEHATATLHFVGVSRAALTELERHRHFSFSVRSQRFVDEGGANIVLPPVLRELEEDPYGIVNLVEHQADGCAYVYEEIVQALEKANVKGKKAREAARAVLPSMTETKMVVTANLRAWLEVIERRTAPDVDAEVREIMTMAREALRPLAPTIFKEH